MGVNALPDDTTPESTQLDLEKLTTGVDSGENEPGDAKEDLVKTKTRSEPPPGPLDWDGPDDPDNAQNVGATSTRFAFPILDTDY
jgi:hypothetical protein